MSSIPIEAALAAVAAACQVARAVADATTGVSAQTKADQSPVTIADFAVQAVIVHALRERGDTTPIVGEEDDSLRRRPHLARRGGRGRARGWPDADADGVIAAIAEGHHRGDVGPYWALDPIDGTKGFLRREQYALCLAYVDGSEPTVGVLGCPNLPRDRGAKLDNRTDAGAIYLAGPSGPAFEVGLDGLDVRPLVVDDPSAHISRIGVRKASDDIVITHSVDTVHTRLNRVQAVLDTMGRQFHAIPCDSQAKYTLVARGQAHAYVRIPTNPERVETVWDHAAGAVIATRAGMIVSDLRGAPLRLLVAARAREELRHRLRAPERAPRAHRGREDARPRRTERLAHRGGALARTLAGDGQAQRWAGPGPQPGALRSGQARIPGGVNSPVRAFAPSAEPVFIGRARRPASRSPRTTSYIDYVGSWGPMILGHAHPDGGRGGAARPPRDGLSASARRPRREVELRRAVSHGARTRRSRWCAASRTRHRGDDERAPRRARLHRARLDRQVRGLLPRPRRSPAGQGRLAALATLRRARLGRRPGRASRGPR